MGKKKQSTIEGAIRQTLDLPLPVEDHVALDYETYYDNDCSIRGTTARNYCKHPEFDAYRLSVWCPEFQFVGDPKDFDWKKLDGRTVVAHNAAFDEAVTKQLVEDGTIPEVEIDWHCTADMCVYFQAPRSLAGACYAYYGTEVEKDVRDKLKGHKWKDVVAQGWADEVDEYALKDSELCWRLWSDYSREWPDHEKTLSQITRAMGYGGLQVDQKALGQAISRLEKIVFDSEAELPWTEEYDGKYKKKFPPTSIRGLALSCAKHGIDPPASTAEDSEERKAWEAQYGDRFPFIRHMSNWRKANKHLKTLKTIQGRILEDGNMPYALKYYGAEATGRWSGDAGFNTQNMPRGEVFGVNIRGFFVPKKGNKFIISDLSQIEPRCLALLCGDWDFLREIAKGVSPYEVHARQTMGWKGGPLKKENPELYILAKARVLSLGYGASWQSFVRSANAYGAGEILRKATKPDEVDMFRGYLRKRDHRGGTQLATWFDNASANERNEAVNAFMQVEDYRKSNPKVIGLWRKLDAAFKKSASEKKFKSTFVYKLPCGRKLRYFNIHKRTKDGGGWACYTQLKDSPKYNRFRYMFGSRIVENACQALARSYFGECLERLWNMAYDIVLQVHDEVVIEVGAEDAEAAAIDIQKAMSISPEWAPNFPVAAEAHITERYTK